MLATFPRTGMGTIRYRRGQAVLTSKSEATVTSGSQSVFSCTSFKVHQNCMAASICTSPAIRPAAFSHLARGIICCGYTVMYGTLFCAIHPVYYRFRVEGFSLPPRTGAPFQLLDQEAPGYTDLSDNTRQFGTIKGFVKQKVLFARNKSEKVSRET